MNKKVLKTTGLGLLLSVGIAIPANAQFEFRTIKEPAAQENLQIKDVPFIVALRKVVPIRYDFSFADSASVDLSKNITYVDTGNWEVNLANILGSLDLAVVSKDDDVLLIDSKSAIKSKQDAKKAEMLKKESDLAEREAKMEAEKAEMLKKQAEMEDKLAKMQQQQVKEDVLPEIKENDVKPVAKQEVKQQVAKVETEAPVVVKKVVPVEIVEVSEVEKVKENKISEKEIVNLTKPAMEKVSKSKIEIEKQVEQPAGYVWKVKRGFTLQETLKSWGEQVKWNVVWQSDRDFIIESETMFEGSFEDAASGLIEAFEQADPPVVGTFYKNKTLVVETTSNGEVN